MNRVDMSHADGNKGRTADGRGPLSSLADMDAPDQGIWMGNNLCVRSRIIFGECLHRTIGEEFTPRVMEFSSCHAKERKELDGRSRLWNPKVIEAVMTMPMTLVIWRKARRRGIMSSALKPIFD
jgi:hypothetical protein